MEPDRSAVLAARENRDRQRASGPVYRASFSTGGYRRLTPRFLPVSNKGHRDNQPERYLLAAGRGNSKVEIWDTRTLLILDGLETLQNPQGPSEGRRNARYLLVSRLNQEK
jgi:hypothetical protein